MTSNGIEILRQLADDLEEEALQVERLDREARRLRDENERLKSSLRTIILMCGEAENANIHVISGEAQMALKREVRE